MKRFTFPAITALAAILMLAQTVLASGFFVARFGGEHGHPTTDNPTAMYYNPAGLSLGAGTRLYIDGNFAWRSFSYTRPVGAIDNRQPDGTSSAGSYTPEGDGLLANSGEGTLMNYLASPFVAIASDFGVKGLGVGLSFYAPFGGKSKYDKGTNFERFPGASDGAQRWWAIEGEIKSVYITGTVAYRFEKPRLSIGLSLNGVKSNIYTARARNTDGTDNLLRANGTSQEGRAVLDTESFDLSVGAGLIWEPIDKMWIGVSYQSAPGFGETEQTGTARLNVAPGPEPPPVDVSLYQTLPDVWHFGFRTRPTDNWELRLFGNYVRWSAFKSQCIISESNAEEEPPQSCDYTQAEANRQTMDQGKPLSSKPLILIPRQWDDGYAIRAGASYWVSRPVELFFGAGYDSNSVPDETLEPALFDTDKVTASLGGRFTFLKESLALGVTYTQVFYFARDISPRGPTPDGPNGVKTNASNLGAVGLGAERRQPDAAGKYEQSIGVLNVNLQYTF